MTMQQPMPRRQILGGPRWQDWTDLGLAIWLFISPWVLGFAITRLPVGPGPTPAGGEATLPGGALANASWNAWVLGVIVFVVAISAIARPQAWQSWVNMLLGIWIFIAPWVLGFATQQTQNAAWDHWVVGFLVFIVSLSNLWIFRRATVADTASTAPLSGDLPPRTEPSRAADKPRFPR
jgi:hypothetical protein